MDIKAYKMDGLGNDFVIIDNRQKITNLSKDQIIKICDRKFIGCDQLIIIKKNEISDASLEFYNSDGGTSGACGNGTRCVANLLAKESNKNSIVLTTLSGNLKSEILGDRIVSTEIGIGKTEWNEIPLSKNLNTNNLNIKITDKNNNEHAGGTAINVGNPHIIFFVDNYNNFNIEKIGPDFYKVEGTPADCVLAGLYHVMIEEKPDLIISGVNRGQNIAEDVLYSGTVGAAIEGAIHGIKSIALSQSYSKETLGSPSEFDPAQKHAVAVCQKLLSDDPFSENCFNGFYNINFPACKADQVRGVKVCRTGLRQKNTFSISSQTSPSGKTFLWVNHNPTSAIPSPKSDGAYLKAGYVTISALQTELNWIEKNHHLKSLFEE